ncbi:TetR/AcrR family transcriptional regulator [soil metagenome]
MARAAQTARSERTREALRQAALVRFLAQGVEDTSAEQIAADAGVSLRTFYRHFTSKHDLLFADYDAGLHWFRTALEARPAGEPLITSVQAAIFAFPYDVSAVAKIATLRSSELDPERIVRHIRQVEADFAAAVEARITGGDVVGKDVIQDASRHTSVDQRLRVKVTARCISAAVFGAMEVWMLSADRSLAELARLCRAALASLESGFETGPVDPQVLS